MGERAVAVVPDGDTAVWYRSQWGGGEDVLEKVFDAGSPVEELLTIEWQSLGRAPLERIHDVVDSHTVEVLYLVAPGGIEVFLPLWLGLGLREPPASPARGTLVPVSSLKAVRACRSSLRRVKGPLLDCATEGKIPPESAEKISTRVCELICTVGFGFATYHSL